jgi:hypothetical protein
MKTISRQRLPCSLLLQVLMPVAGMVNLERQERGQTANRAKRNRSAIGCRHFKTMMPRDGGGGSGGDRGNWPR